jgi:hypothetical protein
MWELLTDLATIAIVVMVLVSFAPRHIRRRMRQVAGDTLRDLWAATRPLAYRLITGDDAPPLGEQPRHLTVELRGALHHNVEDDFPLPAAENDDLHGGVEDENQPDFAPASEEELRALALALRHNLTTQDKTKSGAIKAGWGLARSGTDPRYARASELYDLATRPPEPEKEFPTLAAARKDAEQPRQRRSKARTT